MQDDRDNPMIRRDFCIRLLGLAAIGGLAGCSSSTAPDAETIAANTEAERTARVRAYGGNGSPFQKVSTRKSVTRRR